MIKIKESLVMVFSLLFPLHLVLLQNILLLLELSLSQFVLFNLLVKSLLELWLVCFWILGFLNFIKGIECGRRIEEPGFSGTVVDKLFL